MWHSLLTADFHGDRHWVLTKPLKYTFPKFMTRTDYKLWRTIGAYMILDSESNTITITVPTGYHTDLASIHRTAWSVISPWDVARGAVVHDLLYGLIRKEKDHLSKTRIKNLRKQADGIFKRGMYDAEPAIPKWKIETCYYFVRCLGWASMIKAAKFKQNAKNK